MRSNWAVWGWLLLGAAVVTAITLSTPNPVPFLIIGYLVVYFGNRIVSILAYVPSPSGLQCESPDHYLNFETDNLHENEFKIWFVDGDWEAGRSYEMSGTVLSKPDTPLNGLRIAERTTVRIYTLPGWFVKARIGWIRSTGKCYVGLPVQLAAQVLDDLRKDCHQIVSIGFKVDTNAKGDPTFPIYLFEMERSSS